MTPLLFRGPLDFTNWKVKAKFLNLLVRLYGALLRLYPQRFRAEFEDEMRAVFTKSLEHAAEQGIPALADTSLRETLDAPLTLFRVHRFSRKRGKKARSDSASRFSAAPITSLAPPSPDGRASWKQAGLEVSLFLSMGAILVLQTYLSHARPVSGPLRGLGRIGATSHLLLIPFFLIGLARGLPRWAYPFGGMLLGCSFLIATRFDILPFLAATLLASLALAVAAVVVNLWFRPLPPSLRRVGQSLRLDWTRCSFCIYGAMPLVIATAFDDARYNNRTPYLAISVLLMVAGAFAYTRSRRAALQMTALLGGLSLSCGCALLDQAAFMGGLESWISFPGHWLAEIDWMLKLWASMMALIAAPFLIRLVDRALVPGRTA